MLSGGGKTPLFGDAVFIKEEFLPWNLNTVESEQILKIVLILISYKKLGLAFSIIAKAKDIGVLKQNHENLIINVLNTRFNGFFIRLFRMMPESIRSTNYQAVTSKNFQLR